MFKFTKREHCAGENVWWSKIQIGKIKTIIRDNPNVDWDALRADRTLRLTINKRFIYTYQAISSLNKNAIGIFNSKEDAGAALLNHHRQYYEKTIINNGNK